jgi:hypothetical protein
MANQSTWIYKQEIRINKIINVMDKREFIKSSLLTAFVAMPVSLLTNTKDVNEKFKHWVWINPNPGDTETNVVRQFTKFYDAGVRGIFFEADSEKHFRIARRSSIEAHRWMWTLNRGENTLLNAHPDWYAKNRKGESCADNPPYVDYYRWLCPSRDEVHAYLEENVRNILSKQYVDGIHLDYVRYCDVILAVNLWDKYGIKQNEELPEYDYCYCEICRNKFKVQHGIDPLEIAFPAQSLSWRKFRYDNVNRLVNRLSAVAASYKKPITAAVFPTPEVARRIVRQDWTNWNLNGVCPMIYHGFYKEDVKWIGDAVAEGIHFLNGKFPLYAGLYLPDFKNNLELQQGMEYALKNGAAGISLFGNVTDEVLTTLEKVSANVNRSMK